VYNQLVHLTRENSGLKSVKAFGAPWPVQIVGKRSSAVLISEEDWKAIQETLYLASIPGMRESIKKGLKTPVGKCSKEPGW
jgi:PHD/YefM family antitoxin component YafN of YafNO toxin-antitoxin module